MKIVHIVGNRPQFIKLSPLLSESKKYRSIKNVVVHTGQHYDFLMSEIFFKELKIPKPDYNLKTGSGSQAGQTGNIILKLEKIIVRENPDLVIVYGDTNSTLGGALTAAKLNIPLAHIEAGNRLGVLKTQEEINRLAVDHISDFLFVASIFEKNNLLKENISKEKIFLVGNIMADVLMKYNKRIRENKNSYAVLTLHRAETVDNKKKLKEVLQAVDKIGQNISVIFPIHPRTKKRITEYGLKLKNIKIVSSVSYIEMIGLVKNSKFVMTDSGGLQHETTILQVPCLTLKNGAEWPITLKHGTNLVVGLKEKSIIGQALKIINGKSEIFKRKAVIPEFWDGKTSERIIKILLEKL